MRIRIPNPVNRVLDMAGRYPRSVATVVSATAVTWSLTLVWISLLAAALVAAGLVLFVVVGWFAVRDLQRKEVVRQLRYDMAAKDAQIARLSAGDPSAPTAQLRQIGEAGEAT